MNEPTQYIVGIIMKRNNNNSNHGGGGLNLQAVLVLVKGHNVTSLLKTLDSSIYHLGIY
jgi:hypothetical protein